jgi:hypothetical protein
LRWVVALLLVPLLGLSGCAYSTRPGKLRPGLQTVAVPFFENRSNEPGIEVELTEAILDGLIEDRTLRVTEEEQADALVLGTVRRYTFQEAFFGQDRQAEEYRIDIEVEVSVVDRASQEAIAGPKRIKGTGSYYITEGPEGETDARAQAAQAIVEGIVNLVVEEW